MPLTADTPGAVLITVDGTPLAPEYSAALLSVDVDMEINLPRRAMVTMVAQDYDDTSDMALDFELFSLGAVLEINMGLMEPAPVFMGQISGVSPDLGGTGSVVVVTAYDAAFRLQYGTHARSFEEMTLSMIVEEVVGEAGIGIEADPTEAMHPYVLQNNVSTFDFVIDLGARLGFELISDGELIQFRSPRLADPPVAILEYGVGLFEFRVRAKTLTQGSAVSRVAWDPEVKEPITGEALTAPPDATMGGMEDGFTMSEETGVSSNTAATAFAGDIAGLEELAQGLRSQVLDTFIQGEASCSGNAEITAGSNIEAKGVGGRFNGPYYVTRAQHLFSTDFGYQVQMDLMRTGA